jgi:signal transduction histidine kinase
MRERVAVWGGELHAGPRPEGGYELRARLPVAAA